MFELSSMIVQAFYKLKKTDNFILRSTKNSTLFIFKT